MHLTFICLFLLPFLIAGSTIDGARSLRSFHSTFIRARNSERDAVRVDLANSRFSCERWYIEEFETKVTIKSHCTPGGYLKANANGEIGVSATRVEETKWTPVSNSDGSWSLKNSNGGWLSGKRDGNVRTMERCGEWESFMIESFNRGDSENKIVM